jgi:hypothetical protein
MSCDSSITHTSLMIALLLIEAWLGKTQKTKSGSILESVFNICSSLVKRKQKQTGE